MQSRRFWASRQLSPGPVCQTPRIGELALYQSLMEGDETPDLKRVALAPESGLMLYRIVRPNG
jgi:hypothetical protein